MTAKIEQGSEPISRVAKEEIARVADLLRTFEREGANRPREGERLIAEVLRACRFEVVESGFVQSEEGVDCLFRTIENGKPETIGVEVKAMRNPAVAESVDRALYLHETGRFDSMMIVSRAGFTRAAVELALINGLGKIDLLDTPALHDWIARRQSESEKPSDKDEDLDAYEVMISDTMRKFALRVADNPEFLWNLEWRELEKMTCEVFDGIGYSTVLTRPAKDGGFDLELTAWDRGVKHVYVVEVKHWTESKPGGQELKKLIGVTASRKATGGLLLSSSGFTAPTYSGIAEFEPPHKVRLGDLDKIVSICRLYKRTKTPFWTPIDTPRETLFEQTGTPAF